mmetsp:Transcript_34276/g.74976  ORF Transcript_34276/g.74976 Transcript_34276/m.74976 type:complete len:263 (+) Transcript_34276:1205-1993(+)
MTRRSSFTAARSFSTFRSRSCALFFFAERSACACLSSSDSWRTRSSMPVGEEPGAERSEPVERCGAGCAGWPAPAVAWCSTPASISAPSYACLIMRSTPPYSRVLLMIASKMSPYTGNLCSAVSAAPCTSANCRRRSCNSFSRPITSERKPLPPPSFDAKLNCLNNPFPLRGSGDGLTAFLLCISKAFLLMLEDTATCVCGVSAPGAGEKRPLFCMSKKACFPGLRTSCLVSGFIVGLLSGNGVCCGPRCWMNITFFGFPTN